MAYRIALLLTSAFTAFCAVAQVAPLLPALTAEQREEAAKAQRVRNAKRFLFFSIPTLLNGSNADPSPVSAASLDIGEEKFTLKIGFPRPFMSETKWEQVGRWTASVAPYVASKDKKAKLFSNGDWINTLGVDATLNYLIPTRPWTATADGAKAYNVWMARNTAKDATFATDTVRMRKQPALMAEGDTTSEQVIWLAARGNLDRTEYTLFDTTAAYAEMVNELPLGLMKGYVTANVFFHSKLKKHRWKNSIFCIGAGYGSFTDYAKLEERTLHEGTPVYNQDSTVVRIISDDTDGRIGPLTVSTGMLFFAEGYKTIAFLPNDGALRFGVRYDEFGRGTEGFNTQLSGGFFLNAKKPGSVDVVNIALTLVCGQFQSNGDSDYWNKHVSFVLGTALPLRF